MANERYSVDTGNFGYVIRDARRSLPLPFNYISRQYADADCAKFNAGGSIEVAKAYYTYKVAGTRQLDYEAYRLAGTNPFDEWLEQNKHLFD